MTISFRDPSGFVIVSQDRVLRFVNKDSEGDLRTSLASTTLKKFVSTGRLVSALPFAAPKQIDELLSELGIESLPEDFTFSEIIQHDRVLFQSFPYEWSPEMLHAAASLTLDMAEDLLTEGIGLKDATPYNVLFRGPHPVFVDWLSFERREPADHVWLPYAQFIRTFILPLLVNGSFGLRLDQLLLADRDGVEPEKVYRMCGPLRKLRPPFLTLVTLPTKLGARQGPSSAVYQPKRSASAEKARFILAHQFKQLRRLLQRVAPARAESVWSNYMGSDQHFTDAYLEKKQSFVERALKEFAPVMLLDMGCNNGHFSRIAAQNGATVVAVDQDPVMVGRVWRTAQAESLNILPLTLNLTRPSPAVGWRNDENASFLERSRGRFDAVLMLAVIHHITVSERVPLPEVIDLAAELTTNILIAEFVGNDDPMFRRLARGRDHLYAHLTREYFEAACGRHFVIVRCEELEVGRRWIYLLKRK